jgi:hypothetical protein
MAEVCFQKKHHKVSFHSLPLGVEEDKIKLKDSFFQEIEIERGEST